MTPFDSIVVFLKQFVVPPKPVRTIVDRDKLRDALVIKMTEASLGRPIRSPYSPTEILDGVDNRPGTVPGKQLGEQYRLMADAAIDFLLPDLYNPKKDKK